MRLQFEGSLSDVRSEMEDFLAGSTGGGQSAGSGKTKTTTTKETKKEVINADSLRELMVGIADKDGKKRVLSDYGVSKVSEITDDQIEGIYADMKKLS